MKFIGEMGSWGGHATTCRRQDSSLLRKNSGFGKTTSPFFGISTWCTPIKHPSAHRSKDESKWSNPRFGPWTRRTRF